MKAGRLLRLVLIYVGAGLLVAFSLAPIYWVVVSSISTRTELYAVPYKHWIPREPTLQNYQAIFTSKAQYRAGGYLPSAGRLLAGLRNSLILASVSALILTVLSSLAGYAFSRLNFRGKKWLFMGLLLLMPLPPWISLISLYSLMSSLNLVDSLPGVGLLFVALGAPLYVWLMKTYIDAAPRALEEAALVDGCTRLRALISVVLPVVRPGLVSVYLVAFLSTWNNYLIPLIFTSTSRSQPLTVVLTQLIGQYEVAWEAMSAAAVVTIIPPLLLALFFQRYLIRGLSFGAVRE